ncbi:hypothetical protein [Arthrobacter zhaoguopingii]|uniref:hypothetical protein n=1 Tax=Arthrobacter zhaoguopingii TaxID=2681491 RepID=UPI001357D588|nr:hypothetical protein [Arthrobacter zhaoguopingii]
MRTVAADALRKYPLILALSAMFLVGCDDADNQDGGGSSPEESSQYDDNNGIDTDQGDDARGEDNDNQ